MNSQDQKGAVIASQIVTLYQKPFWKQKNQSSLFMEGATHFQKKWLGVVYDYLYWLPIFLGFKNYSKCRI